MRTRDIEDKLFLDLGPVVEGTGLILLDVQLTSSGKTPVLRLYIYKASGVTLEDCLKVQHVCGEYVDERDPLPSSYTLEVSSPGLERVLRRDHEFEIFEGKLCQVNLFAPVDGKRSYSGRLKGLSPQGHVVLSVGDEEVAFERSVVSRVKLLYEERGREK